MKQLIQIIIFIIISIHAEVTFAESTYAKAKDGIELFNNKKYGEAVNKFNDALVDKPDSNELRYNLGNTYYKLKNYENAEKEYYEVLNGAKNNKLKGESYYNLGNTSFRQGKLDEAEGLYKKALETNPDDKDAKYNLEFVQKEIKRREKEEREGKEDKEGKGKDEDKGGKNKEQTGEKDQKEEEGDKKDSQKGEKDGQKKDGDKDGQGLNEKDKGEEKKGDKGMAEGGEKQKKDKEGEQGNTAKGMNRMTKEEAAILLDSLREERGAILNNQRREKGRGGTVEKDW